MHQIRISGRTARGKHPERCELPKTPLAGKKGKARKGREERKKRERGEGRRDIPPHPLAEA